MLQTLLRMAPLGAYLPFRAGSVRFRRGSLARKLCVGVLQHAALANRGRLAQAVSEIRPLDDAGVTFQPVDSMVMDAVYWFGVRGYEGVLSDIWQDLCKRSSNVLEIGGNVGLFTVIGARRTSGSYTVLEPLPGNAAVLAGNLRLNGLGNVRLLQAAAIPEPDDRPIQLNVPDEKRGAPVGAHLVNGSEVSGRSSLQVITVKGLSFAALVPGRDLVKIDAEGVEAALLLSAYAFLIQHRPTLVVEVLPEASDLAEVIRRLSASAGYSIWVVPAWGSDQPIEVAAADFTADLPKRHNSKDVILRVGGLPGR